MRRPLSVATNFGFSDEEQAGWHLVVEVTAKGETLFRLHWNGKADATHVWTAQTADIQRLVETFMQKQETM